MYHFYLFAFMPIYVIIIIAVVFACFMDGYYYWGIGLSLYAIILTYGIFSGWSYKRELDELIKRIKENKNV